jgi:excisionase family DNA binding protein
MSTFERVSENIGPRHYTVAEIAHRFGAHPVTCRRWIREGRIKPLRLGRLVRISAAEVERFEKEGSL